MKNFSQKYKKDDIFYIKNLGLMVCKVKPIEFINFFNYLRGILFAILAMSIMRNTT